ncbi:MAG: hypothetical protein Q4G27_05320 [Flavobacteriaceae bacterium]|nr:hypothetical protein [Flavobacteriaceae bacterium]
MKYYKLQPSWSEKVIGQYPQVKNIEYKCDVWNEPKFIEHQEFKKINFSPITANAILNKTAKITDLINVTGMGFTRKLLLSGKLKLIIESFRKDGIQFFESSVFKEDKIYNEYWVMHIFEINFDSIDFSNTNFYLKNYFDTINRLYIKNLEEFLYQKNKIDKIGYPINLFIDNVHIIDEYTHHFFALSNVENGINYIVSDLLKDEIEINNCTGIEFTPLK